MEPKNNWFDKLIYLRTEQDLNPLGWTAYMSWYFCSNVKFKIFMYVKNREFSLMVPRGFDFMERSIRMLKVTKVQSLDFFYDVTGMKQKKTFYNFYSSVATYQGGIPSLPFDIQIRRDAKKEWHTNHWKTMNGYDFFVDIDGSHENFGMTKFSAVELKRYFDEFKIPYYLRFSGKGFHFIVPYRFFEDVIPAEWKSFDPTALRSVYKFFGRLTRMLVDDVSEMIDEQIYDARRLIKVPFSLALYKEQYVVCLPINSDKELQDFDVGKANYTLFTPHMIYTYNDTLFNSNGSVDPLIKKAYKRGYLDIKYDIHIQ